MKAEITLEQMWMNPQMWNFFMRGQAQNTLKELMDAVVFSGHMTLSDFFNRVESYNEDWDVFEEMLYNDTIEDIQVMLDMVYEDSGIYSSDDDM